MNILHKGTGAILVSSQKTTMREAAEEGKAILQGANLRGANLNDANLQRANLQRANLQGVNLNDAKLGNLRILDGGLRSDGYRFLYTEIDGDGPHVVTGCYNFASFAEAREHWRTGTMLGVETMLILDHLEKLVTLRWGEVES